jgi:hypothetical protein
MVEECKTNWDKQQTFHEDTINFWKTKELKNLTQKKEPRYERFA